jgi:hypothetical protein
MTELGRQTRKDTLNWTAHISAMRGDWGELAVFLS